MWQVGPVGAVGVGRETVVALCPPKLGVEPQDFAFRVRIGLSRRAHLHFVGLGVEAGHWCLPVEVTEVALGWRFFENLMASALLVALTVVVIGLPFMTTSTSHNTAR